MRSRSKEAKQTNRRNEQKNIWDKIEQKFSSYFTSFCCFMFFIHEPKMSSKRTRFMWIMFLQHRMPLAYVLLSIGVAFWKASSHMGLSYMRIEFDIKSDFHFHPLSLFVSPIFALLYTSCLKHDNFCRPDPLPFHSMPPSVVIYGTTSFSKKHLH